MPSTLKINGVVGQTTPANLTLRNVGKGLLSGDWPKVTIPPYQIDAGHFDLQPGITTSIPISFTATVKGTAPSAALAIQ